MTLDQFKAIWRAFVNLGTMSAIFGNETSLHESDRTTLNGWLDVDSDWTPPGFVPFTADVEMGTSWGNVGQMFPSFSNVPAKPKKPVQRDIESRADRVLKTLLQEPQLAVLVATRLNATKFAKPWRRNYADIWARETLGGKAVAAYMKNDGAPNNGGNGKPNWRLLVIDSNGDQQAIDTTDDVRAGRDALDFFLINTGWVLL